MLPKHQNQNMPMIRKPVNVIVHFFHRYWRSFFALSGFAALFLLVRIFSFSVDAGNKSGKDYFNSHYKIFSLRIPKDLNFSGEQVPVKDFTVAESIDRELLINTYWHSQTLLMFKRANRWFPIIESILKKNGVPEDFKYIALVESGLTNIVSPAGATGYWQLLESTATNYGLEVDDDIDERYNIERSTEAACNYFLEAYGKLHNWTLVAASYNIGIGGIQAQLEKQKAANYYDLFLNDETSRYVYRILAVKDILTRPQAYGFVLRKQDLYPPIPTIKLSIDSSIKDLPAFAISQNVTYKMLKLMNPWMRKDLINNPNKKMYSVLLPGKGVDITKWESYLESDTNQYLVNIETSIDTVAKQP